MSPIPSVATAFTLSPAASSVALNPDSGGQSASTTPQHLLGTGGLLFAVVALVSVVGYFYHGRGATNGSRATNTWASLSRFLSGTRHRDTVTPTAPAADWPIDLEVGPEQHVSMVYARFFHPTFWNLVECHPGTPSTPAIYVEDEANEFPASDPTLPGVNSFLHMDDDADEKGNEDDRSKRPCEKPDRGVRLKVEVLPPYDTSSPTNVKFDSEIIGTTVRPGIFLCVPGEQEPEYDPSSEDFLPDSELDLSYLAYDGIVRTTDPPISAPSARRYGMANMAYLAQSLKDAIPDDGYDMVPTISHRTGLLDVLDVETDPTASCRYPEQLGRTDDQPTSTNCDIGTHDNLDKSVKVDPAMACVHMERFEPVDDDPADCYFGVHDSCDGLQTSVEAADTDAAPHPGLDLMRRLLAELRDPNLDCSPRALSEDSDYDYDDDDCQDDDAMQRSLESTCSTPRIDGDMSEKGPIYPLTPPSTFITSPGGTPRVRKAHVRSPAFPWFNEEVQVISATSSNSPPTLSMLYGPRFPSLAVPRK